MKLIVQNIDGDTYAFYESERVFKRNEKNRGGLRLDPAKVLPHECTLGKFPNSYFVFNVKK